MENEKLTLVKKYHDKAKIKLWKQYHVDQFYQKQGEEKWWYEDGQIAVIGNRKDGGWHGKSQEWWMDGEIAAITTHHLKKERHGTKIIFKYGK